jgi:hypothetical protein
MRKRFFLMTHARFGILAACMMTALSLTYLSCDKVYDNIKDFSVEEIVYPAHVDTAIVRIGYERVEIDLSKYGRIPSEQMNLGKAKKIIVEYDNTRIVYEGIYSWVNIRGLTQPKLYRFSIYTEDEYGDRSIPVEIAATPYTIEDTRALALPFPTVYESTSSGMIEWKNDVSGEMFDFYSYTYSYTDKDGKLRNGSGEGSYPSFFIDNILAGQEIDVTMNCKILPKTSGVPILDTVIWEYVIPFSVSGNTTTIFLDKPSNGFVYEPNAPVNLSWIKETGISEYVLQVSTDRGFSEAATATVNVGGDINSYTLTASDIARIPGYYMGATVYWKVSVPGNSEIITQTRQFDVPRMVVLVSREDWAAESLGGNHPWGEYGGEPYRLFDGDLYTGWHTSLGQPLPQCLVVDMKKSQTIYAIRLSHLPEGLANGWIYFRSIHVYITDTPVVPDLPQASWGEPAVRYEWQGDADPFNIDVQATGRYMILYFPTSRTDSFISFAELDVYVFNN